MKPKNLRIKLAYTAGIITALSGFVVLIGWQTESYALQTFGLGGVTMKANTAISFLLTGLALILLQRDDRRLNINLARICSAMVALLGLLVLSQYVFAVNLGIDEFLFSEVKNAVATVNPGRMAPNASLNFIFLSIVLFAVSFRKMERSLPLLFLFVSAFTISIIGLFGYLFGLSELTGLAAYTKLAINTSLSFVVLSIGIYFTMFNTKKEPATLEYKLLSGLTIASVIIILGAIISLASIQSLVSASNRVEHTFQVKLELRKISQEVYELIAADRAYIISGNENFMKQWKQSKADLPKLIMNFENLIKDDAKQQKELVDLKKLINERIDFSELLISNYIIEGEKAAKALFATLKGVKINDQIEEIITRMGVEEERLLLERNAKEADNTANTITIIVLNLGFILLLFALMFVLVEKDITGRRKAEEALLKLNEGLEQRVNERTAEVVQSLEQIKKANRTYAVLSNVNQMIVRVKDKQTLFDEACHIAVEDGKFRMVWIGMHDQQTNKVQTVASAGFEEDYLKTINLDLSIEKYQQCPLGQAIKLGSHYVENDIFGNRAIAEWHENAVRLGYKSAAAFPITLFGKVIGAYSLYSETAGFFDEAEMKLLDEMAMDISFAVESIENRDKAEKIENEIHNMNAELEIKVEQRTEQLADTNEKLSAAKLEAERANVAKSEFISRMSHELRTPMNSILGFAQLMNMGELTPAHKKGVDHILKSGKHLLDLINEVLDLSRIEAGELSISLEPVHLHGIVSETMDVIKPIATTKNVTFEFPESPVCDLFVKADRQKLKQILLNLLSNAVKYNREGGSLKVECEVKRLPIIRISINDTGKGIAPEYMARLFNPFERVGSEISEVEGIGLGLAVSKKLIEAMNGTIGVESEPGVGSTFWIELPRTEGQIDRYERKSGFDKPEIESAVSGTLLYIEDNVSNIQLVEQILETHRPQIRLITEMYGKRTVQLATDYQPDIILLDLDLPDIHGSEVLKQLLANNKTKSIPVVILSADAMNSQIEKLLKAGAKNYLTKPLDVLEFLRVVDMIIKPSGTQNNKH
ncbi:MAG: ATP-binding protein [Bacteroidales bacterium]|nr:ATP-binding protein [Bacteroidales bacterium]